ncbi:MAG: hypothetical protein K2U26_15540 [Cyclobacteriaceae bacterium]|nr:hypothetical protein [Cyclobacteriaceae bacterium]
MTRWYKAIGVMLMLTVSASPSFSQQSFGDRCLGMWEGMMHIYNKGSLKDSVKIKFTVAKIQGTDSRTWKTEYLSPTRPMVKDYVLRVVDKEKSSYVTDEGGGLELNDYLFGNKLYNIFEVQGITLTSTYELVGNNLIFEVTSGKELLEKAQDVTNFSVDNLQRAVMRRIK